MSDSVLVNISNQVNAKSIRRETRNGRNVIVIPSAVAKFDTVLNGILYPREELEKSYAGLDRTPAPFGHPKVGGNYVSARDPEAINQHWSGAWNENPRIDGDRIMADVVLDVERAGQHPDGKALMDAVNDGKPVSTSTGLLLERFPALNDSHEAVGRNYSFDHVALLLNEAPAIGTEQGVGLMVNGKRTDVINSTIGDENVDKVVNMIFELVDEPKRSGIRGKVKEFFSNVLNYAGSSATEPVTNDQSAKEDEMSDDRLKSLEEKVDALVANSKEKEPVADKALTEKLDAINAKLEAIQANAQAAEKAEHDAAVSSVVEAEILDKEVAEKMDTNALKALHEKFGKPGSAAGLNSAFNAKGGETTYEAPEVE